MSRDNVLISIQETCAKVGRDSKEVTLVAVSKMQATENITPLLDAGHRAFGENRVQEASEKWPQLRDKYTDIKLHAIGQLQTNKAKEAVKLFDVIETIDRIALADSLQNEMEKQNRHLPCFIQVNTGEELQKGGVPTKELETLFRYCTEKAGLNIKGLMCIPPATDIPDLHFALLHKLSGELGLPCLSMGMSGDFEIALRYGATNIRIGRSIFGERTGTT